MLKKILERASACAVLLPFTMVPALAQERDWTYNLALYLWINETTVTADTPRGEVEAELSFTDALESLEFAFMGAVEARNGPWGFIGDLLYFSLSAEGSTPNGLLFSEVRSESKITALSTYALYRFHEDERFSFDAGAGLRALWTEVETTLVGAALPTETYDYDKDWVDPVIALRGRVNFNDQWFGTLLLDAGGTGDSTSWQVLTTVGYQINEKWALRAGYRYLKTEWDTRQGESSLEFSGPILGATFRF
jgi:opacity protein-like surface antigen